MLGTLMRFIFDVISKKVNGCFMVTGFKHVIIKELGQKKKKEKKIQDIQIIEIIIQLFLLFSFTEANFAKIKNTLSFISDGTDSV